MYIQNKLLGSICIFAGAVLLILVAGEFLIRMLVAIFALYLISYGMRLSGYPPITFMAQSWYSGSRF